ncbi:MAG: hypothetical protein ACYCPW_00400 [Nitrososphaerales archaeon]
MTTDFNRFWDEWIDRISSKKYSLSESQFQEDLAKLNLLFKRVASYDPDLAVETRLAFVLFMASSFAKTNNFGK